MEGRPIIETPSVKLLGTNITNNMSLRDNVATINKTASQKLGVLFRCRKLYTPEQLLLLYKTQIRPSLEYCSHIKVMETVINTQLLRYLDNNTVIHDRQYLQSLICGTEESRSMVNLIIDEMATKKLGVVFRCRRLYTSEQLLLLYKEHRSMVGGLSLFYTFSNERCSSQFCQIGLCCACLFCFANQDIHSAVRGLWHRRFRRADSSRTGGLGAGVWGGGRWSGMQPQLLLRTELAQEVAITMECTC
nr:unnamed protein product [Callosobruchus analis]